MVRYSDSNFSVYYFEMLLLDISSIMVSELFYLVQPPNPASQGFSEVQQSSSRFAKPTQTTTSFLWQDNNNFWNLCNSKCIQKYSTHSPLPTHYRKKPKQVKVSSGVYIFLENHFSPRSRKYFVCFYLDLFGKLANCVKSIKRMKKLDVQFFIVLAKFFKRISPLPVQKGGGVVH